MTGDFERKKREGGEGEGRGGEKSWGEMRGEEEIKKGRKHH